MLASVSLAELSGIYSAVKIFMIEPGKGFQNCMVLLRFKTLFTLVRKILTWLRLSLKVGKIPKITPFYNHVGECFTSLIEWYILGR